MPDETLLTTSEAAKLLGVSDNWIVRHRLSGTGPAYVRIGFYRKYRKSDLQAYVDANRIDPSANNA